MKMYEIISNMAASFGITFDEAYVFLLYFAFAFVGGYAFLVSLFWDVGHYVFRLVRCLLRFIIRRIRHREKVEP